jgi:uncharacterized damage-inducible protein DinB
MLLQHSSTFTLGPLLELVSTLGNERYACSLKTLSGSSVGKHVRHVLEFYQCLFKGIEIGSVNYEKRQRNLALESDIEAASRVLQEIVHFLNSHLEDKALQLEVTMENDALSVSIPTTYYRELAYNIEHCIHHLAIIRIGVETQFPDIQLPQQFGIAYSTLRYQKSVSA